MRVTPPCNHERMRGVELDCLVRELHPAATAGAARAVRAMRYSWWAETVEEFSARLLGRHVVRSSHDISASGHAAAEMPGGNSEISDECVLVFIEENVVRLDVAVHQSASVGVIESRRDLGRDAGGSFRRKRAMPANAITQRAARQVWHHQENVVLNHSEIDDLADVRVHQLRRGFRFPLEPLPHLVLAREVRMKNLDYHR